MMKTLSSASAPRVSLGPDRVETAIGWAALLLLGMTVAAIVRGLADWEDVLWTVWLHLAAIIVSLALTPVILWNQRGDRRHRTLGYVWIAAMGLAAVSSFFVRQINGGDFSPIHLLSVFTLSQLPIIVWSARAHNHRRHRSAVKGIATGALLIAGFFTFPFGRLLGQWLFS